MKINLHSPPVIGIDWENVDDTDSITFSKRHTISPKPKGQNIADLLEVHSLPPVLDHLERATRFNTESPSLFQTRNKLFH